MKNFTKKLMIIILLLALCGFANAREVLIEEAQEIATEWMIFKSGLQNLEVMEVIPRTESDSISYYTVVFENDSFIMISADDIAYPILGYSLEPTFSKETKNPNITSWLDTYHKQIQWLKNNKTRGSEYQEQWDDLRTESYKQRGNLRSRKVEPLLKVNWNQGEGWNKFCPEDPEGKGPGGRPYAGCVAIAMAQYMSFWQHPEQGTGSNSYNLERYGNISEYFGDAIYNWEEMSDTTPDDHNALLIYHVGVAMDMNYSPEGSGAYSYKAPSVMKKYFGYSSNMKMENRYSYEDSVWNNMTKDELDKGRPVLYTGRSESAGHMFNLDGYDEDNHFHINWGWGGRSNGYFYLNSMVTHDGGHDWAYGGNSAIFGAVPDVYIPEILEIEINKPIENIAGQEEEWTFYKVKNDTNSTKIKIEISGGTGDADLYVKSDSKPDENSYDCRPYKSGNNEICQEETLSGTCFIGIKGYNQYSGVTLSVTLDE